MSSDLRPDRTGLPPGSRVVCAVSGGADSVCLLHLLLSRDDLTCFCAHFDHGIRPESGEDAAFVESLCRQWGVPFYTRRGDVPARAAETGESLETAGRELRYAFLRRAAEHFGADVIATAHTLDDNAETVLFRLARGTGLRGLGGIPPERDGIVRPLLGIRRREIEAYLRERGIPWREDPTNALDGAARNRVRHHVLPALEAVHPAAAENIARLTALAREDEEFLNSLAAEKLRHWGDALPVSELKSLPRSLSRRVIRLWLGGELSREGAEAVLSLCDAGPSAALDLPGVTVRREYDRLLRGAAEIPALPERALPLDGAVELPEAGLRAECRLRPAGTEIQRSFNIFSFSCAIICDKLTVTRRIDGDRIALPGREGTHRVKKLLADRKIPLRLRDAVPVLRQGERVLAVYGFGQDRTALPRPGEPFYEVKFLSIKEKET